jgi:hypothetical protein
MVKATLKPNKGTMIPEDEYQISVLTCHLFAWAVENI